MGDGLTWNLYWLTHTRISFGVTPGEFSCGTPQQATKFKILGTRKITRFVVQLWNAYVGIGLPLMVPMQWLACSDAYGAHDDQFI